MRAAHRTHAVMSVVRRKIVLLLTPLGVSGTFKAVYFPLRKVEKIQIPGSHLEAGLVFLDEIF